MTAAVPTTTTATGSLWSPRAIVARLVSGRTWRATAMLLSGMFVAIPIFATVFTLLAVTAAMIIVLPAAVVLSMVTIFVTRLCGRLERYRARTFLDIDLGSPHEPWMAPRGYRKLTRPLARASTWKEITYHLISLPLGVVLFTLALVAWSVPITLVLLAAGAGALPGGRADVWLFTISAGAPAIGAGLLGLVGLCFTPFAIEGMAWLDGWVITTLLGPSRQDALDARVVELETSRTGVVDAAEAERRRIERDLHDGAQQRLVALAMGLGMAKEKLATDPDQARVLLDEAHAEAKQALVELRNLARGIHPAVLTDRGLDAALSAVAARSPVPVTLTIDLSSRPDQAVEGIAYFIVSEALANVAKHAQATAATVNVAQRGTRLILEVTDNGRGGADADLGTGLVGLRDRVAGVDGWMHVSSPVGGPTTLLVELPCAS